MNSDYGPQNDECKRTLYDNSAATAHTYLLQTHDGCFRQHQCKPHAEPETWSIHFHNAVARTFDKCTIPRQDDDVRCRKLEFHQQDVVALTCTEPECVGKAQLNDQLQPIRCAPNASAARGWSLVPRRVPNSALNLLPRNNRDAVWGRSECGGAR